MTRFRILYNSQRSLFGNIFVVNCPLFIPKYILYKKVRFLCPVYIYYGQAVDKFLQPKIVSNSLQKGEFFPTPSPAMREEERGGENSGQKS
jgi:hypothetical protein